MNIRKPDANTSVDERLAYYRKKYGEDFQLPGGSTGETKSSQEGFFSRLGKKLGFKKKK